MRVIGVDFGGKRIGIAVGETETGIASPRNAIAATGTLKKDAIAIKAIADAEEATKVIVGLPLKEGEEEPKMAKICRKLADAITEQGIETVLIDEAFTSIESDAALREHDWTAATRRKYVDSEAACRILERFFDV
jgi:putative holliday junction resolvase